jgi:hypothetical protein
MEGAIVYYYKNDAQSEIKAHLNSLNVNQKRIKIARLENFSLDFLNKFIVNR